MDMDRDMDVDVDMGRSRSEMKNMSSLLSSSSTKIIAGDVLSRRRFVRRRFVTRRRLVTETFCYGDVLLGDVLSRRRFVRRRFVCASEIQLRNTRPRPAEMARQGGGGVLAMTSWKVRTFA
jgi:hypothetical protein